MNNFSRLCIQNDVDIDIDIDRISSFPVQILTHILSFLTTKEAVHTCILSIRWKNVWASVPVLNFHLGEFINGYPEGEYVDPDIEYEDPQPSFERFLSGVLKKREPLPLDSFLFRWGVDGSCHDTSLGWLHHIALLMPRLILIIIHKHSCLDFPDLVFSCASLSILELALLNIPSQAICPKSISLPSLKVLHLSGLVLCDNFTKLLFLGCPVLEELVLQQCNLEIADFSCNILKKLALNYCYCHYSKQMQVSCPGLLSLAIRCVSMERILLKNISSTVNPYISLADNSNLMFLSSLFNVTTLSLDLPSCRVKELLEKGIPKCLPFNYLRSLELRNWLINHFCLIASFLEHDPHLEKLTLDLSLMDNLIPTISTNQELIQTASREVTFQRLCDYNNKAVVM